MSDSYQDWLAQLDEQSRRKQHAFLGRIASKLGKPRVAQRPEHPYRGAPAYWDGYELPLEERIALFCDRFREAGGHAERVADWAAALAFIADKVRAHGARVGIRQDQPELAALDWQSSMPEAKIHVWNRREKVAGSPDEGSAGSPATGTGESDADPARTSIAARADFGICAAAHAVAYTGSVVMLSSAGHGRSVTLLPNLLFVPVPSERLATRPGEVLRTFGEACGGDGVSAPDERTGFSGAARRADCSRLPAGIHFISGPSRSADIENDLTIGVHGPGIVYAILIG